MDNLTSKQIKTHLVGLREGLRVGLRLGRGVGFEVSTSNMLDSQPVRSTVASSDDVAGFKVGVSVTSNMPDSEPVGCGVGLGVGLRVAKTEKAVDSDAPIALPSAIWAPIAKTR